MAASSVGTDDMQKALKELTSAKMIKEDVTLLMAPHLNFEQLLVPAPLSICILGRLMLISTQADFDLTKRPPKGGFQYLRHPNSFRTSLVQVANDGYKAFNKAHSHMDKIRLESLEIPDTLKRALNILYNGSAEEIEDMLPDELDSMKNSVDDCLRYATETEKGFEQVMLVTAELLEACVSAKGQLEQEHRDTQIKLRIANVQKAKLEMQEQLNKESIEKLEATVNKAEEEYYKALDNIPSSMTLIGMQVAENTLNTVSGALNCVTLGVGSSFLAAEKTAVKAAALVAQNAKGFGAAAQGIGKMFQSAIGPGTTEKIHTQNNGSSVDEFVHVLDDPLMKTCLNSIKLKSHVQLLYNTFVTKDDCNLNLDTVNTETKSQLQYCNEAIKSAKDELVNFNNEIAQKLCTLCNALLCICSEISEVCESIHKDEETCKDIAGRLSDLHCKYITISSEAEAIMGNAQFNVKAPKLEKAQNCQGEYERSNRDIADENAKLKVAQTCETMKHSQEMYDKACARLQDTSIELRHFMKETAELDMKTLDLEKIRDTLRKGVKAFAELREQWSKMVQFFQMTSNIIDVCIRKSVKRLIQNVEKAADRNIGGYDISGLRRDMIYQQTFQAAKMSYLVNMISTNYVKVSNKHVMSNIAGLGKLLSYESDSQADEIKQEMDKLTQRFEQAEDDIINLVFQSKREFDQTVERRLRSLSKALPSSESDKRITAAVKEGVTKANRKLEGVTKTNGSKPNTDIDTDELF